MPKSAYNRGWAAWQSGDLAGARSAFQDAVQKDPKSPAPHYALGAVLDRLGDASGAQQEYRAAFTMKSDYEAAIGGYAASLEAGGHFGEADTFLTDQHAKLPKSPAVTTFLSEVKSLEKDSGSAQQLAQDALRLDPSYKEAMVAIARDHYRARRMELARYALQAILDGFGDASPARDKNNAEAHLLRGLIERESSQRAQAMTDFDAAVKARRDLVEATIQLGVMKLEAGNAQEATPLLETAVKFAPKNALAHLNLADAYRLDARIADARKEFDQALALDSSLASAHYDLGLLYLFSPSIPGTSANDQVATALKELEEYKSMRVRSASGAGDDVDELISRAQAKQADLKLAASTPPPAPAPAPAKSGAPAASAAPAAKKP
jgi:Tfp pilus assembly protein PilF